MKRKIVYFSFSKKCKQRSGPFTFINHLYSLHFSSSLAKWHQCPTHLSKNGVRKRNEASSDKYLWLHVSPINIRVTNYESTPHLLALITEKPTINTINRTSFIKVFSSRNLFKLLGGKYVLILSKSSQWLEKNISFQNPFYIKVFHLSFCLN